MKLAIFDIDGTIFRSSLVIELVRALVKEKIFSKAADQAIQKEYVAWLNRKGSYSDYISKVVKIYIKHIAGKPADKIFSVAREVIKLQKDRTYRFTRDLIKQLKKQKYFLVAISGSPSYIVKEYAKTIGFNRFFGTEMEIQNGKFTGKILSQTAAFHKAKIVKEFLKGKNNRSASLAIGDTEGDIAMLSLVEKPIAFNPNFHLAREAKKRGWTMVVERKDVIYKLSSPAYRTNGFQISK